MQEQSPSRPPRSSNMRLRRLHLRNFKKFAEIDLELRPFQLLVGPNNSGKSTALQGCALLDFCYRICSERRDGEIVLKNRTLSTDQFSVIPVASPRDLWLDRRLDFRGKLVELGLAAEFSSDKRLSFGITFAHNRFSIQVHEADTIPEPEAFRVALVPGFTGFLPQEEKRTLAIRRDLQAHGQHGAIVRNLLFDLKSDEPRWRRFLTILEKAFPQIRLREPEFEEEVDRYIRVLYEEETTKPKARRRAPQFDLFAAGSGFHQFVQIFAGALHENATTILLDEPDAHLFGKLQDELYGVLIELTKEGSQIIAATHSGELIGAAEPDQIITFANGPPSRLKVAPEMLAVIDRLGTIDNLSWVLIDAHRRVVVVEDESDERLLRLWMERVLGDEFARVQRRLIFLHAHRRPSGDGVNLMLDAITRAFRVKNPNLSVQAFVIADRDYRPDALIDTELKKYTGDAFRRQEWHVWARCEIENYHLDPRAIVEALRRECEPVDESLFTGDVTEAQEWFERTVDQQRENVIKRVMDALVESEKGLQASTALERASESVNQRWEGSARYELADAKERVFPELRRRIQERWNINLSDSAIIRAVAISDIPDEIRALSQRLRDFVIGQDGTGLANTARGGAHDDDSN